MKLDTLIIRIVFIILLGGVGYLLNPLSETPWLAEYDALRHILSGIMGIIFAVAIIFFEVRVRQATLKTLIGAAIGSTLGILGAYLIGMLISSQHSAAVSETMKTFLTVALVFFMGYIGLMVGGAKGDYIDLSSLGGIFSDKHTKRDYRILDTSVIIDGRIADVAETGFLVEL